MVSGDSDGNNSDVYERFANVTTQISVGGAFAVNDPLPATYKAASSDGTKVFFETAEALGQGDVDSQASDVYEKAVAMTAGFPRPKGATPTRVALVEAYKPCTDPNTSHQSPPTAASCNPPIPVSDFLTVGTPDANGAVANSIGSLRMDVIVGDPATPADEADIALKLSLTDVRKQSDLSDYPGELKGVTDLRITDKANAPLGDPSSPTLPATTQDVTLNLTATCAATGSTTVGGTCSVNTTAKAVMPGLVREGKRAIYKVGEIDVFDGGADGIANTAGNTLFAWRGLFVP